MVCRLCIPRIIEKHLMFAFAAFPSTYSCRHGGRFSGVFDKVGGINEVGSRTEVGIEMSTRVNVEMYGKK